MATLTQWGLVAETREWVGPITFEVDGDPVTGFEVAVTDGTARPGDTWTTPDAHPGGGPTVGVLVGVDTAWPLVVGHKYTIWARFTDDPERPAERAGSIKVT